MASSQDIIQRILQSSRAGQAPQAVQGMQPQAQNPFMPNPQLEQAAAMQGNNVPMHPIIKQIMSHLGLLNLIRNNALQPMVDPSQA